MKSKLSLLVLGLVVIITVAGMGGGCGETITTYFYYYPDWTPDGKIICSKNKQVKTQGVGTIGGSGGSVSNYYTLTIMDAEGSNERDIRAIGNSAIVAASPLGNYYAYTESYSNIIHVITTSDVSVSNIDCGASVDSLDWSSDESRIVYSIASSSTNEIHIVDRNGMNDTYLTIGGNVAWEIGDHIAFEYPTPEGITLSVIKSDGSSLNRLRIGYGAQILNTNKILFVYVPEVRQINIDGTQDEQIFTNYYYRKRPRISADNLKIVSMDASKNHGIFIINITGTGEVQLR